MTRFAGRMTFAVALSLVSSGAALAADRAASSYADRCGPAEIVTAPYKEQICYAGTHGYAACRWVRREYAVRMPAECPRIDVLDEAYKIPRKPIGRERGIVAKS